MPIRFEPLDYAAYAKRLREVDPEIRVREYGTVTEPNGTFPLFRLEGGAGEDAPLLLVTSGFHGEERSGPLTLAARFGRFAAQARLRGVRLVAFPCINPSGFVRGTRYNASGEKPNNDLLRYETAPGVWKGELQPGESFLRSEVFRGSPQETRALLRELEALPTPRAMLDIHQDNYAAGPRVYAYTFGPKAPYLTLLERSRRWAEIGAGLPVDELRRVGPDGLIEFHDGSVTDYFVRRGSRYVATLETTTETPLERSAEIDSVWVEGFIELAAATE